MEKPYLTLNHCLKESCPEEMINLVWTLCEHKINFSYFKPLRFRGVCGMTAQLTFLANTHKLSRSKTGFVSTPRETLSLIG